MTTVRLRHWHPTPVLLPGKPHGHRSLVGCSPWGREESDTTERPHFHFLLSCTGEGNGNPFQCSCLENPRDGGAWWAAVYGSHRVGHDWSDLAAAAADSDIESTENKLVVAGGRANEEGCIGSLGLADANYYTGNGQTVRSYCAAQGTIFHKLWKTIIEKNMKESGYV